MSDNRVFSFSVKPEDVPSLNQIKALQSYCKTHHINFSSLVVKGIVKVNKELELNV